MKRSIGLSIYPLCWVSLVLAAVTVEAAAPVVPGTGEWIEYVGDDFESDGWDFIHNHPKSSRENDERLNGPTGRSTNGRWFEGPERGQPDHMKVVATPDGGIPGSDHALLVRTLNSGIPGYSNRKVEQDDLVVDVTRRLGGSIPVSEVPSFVVSLYLPPWDQWENRSGPHFGIRGTTRTHVTKAREQTYTVGNRFRRSRRTRMVTSTEIEPYWPGMWIHFRSKTDSQVDQESAYVKVRGNNLGHDFKVMEMPEPGWYTFGMSFTGDGQVHFYAKEGIGELSAADHLTSQFPYTYRAETFDTFFFNIVNRNDGNTWSTPFVIDDPQLYVVNSHRIDSIVRNKERNDERHANVRHRKTASRDRNAR